MPKPLVRTSLLPALLALSCTAAAPTPPPPATARPLPVVKVEVWHDLVCPWCRIGLHTLDAAVASTTAAKVEVVHRPFQLEPNAPQSGTDMRAHLAEKFGADRLDAMLARVGAAGARHGVTFDWDAVKVSPNTAAAHAVTEWAPADKRPALVKALHRAHFDEGKNLGDPTVLGEAAQSVGLERAAAEAAAVAPARLEAVRTARTEASRRGITGVPYHVVGGRVLNGMQPPEALRAAIEAAAGASNGASRP
jgi:predicted DsbA family dithiol-disulfide isomerase